MPVSGHDTLNVRRSLDVGGSSYDYFSLPEAEKQLGDISRLPVSLKVLLENLLRYEDNRSVTVDHVKAMIGWLKTQSSDTEIAYRPARVLMQDFTGVPAVVDLAAMRQAMVALGGDPAKINPLSSCDLVIDHSVQVDAFGASTSFERNVELEYERNAERYTFLRWGSQAFDSFRVVPPGTGICHQVNLEYLAQVVWTGKEGNKQIAYPDTLVGTDSHTTMVNGLGVLGWGVGGIEAEAAMLGQPVSMLIPEVIGFRLTGRLPEGTTATDLVLTVTQMLRKKGVVGKFVEFFGHGLDDLPLADRATIANMAPEYGATCGFFPVDKLTIDYLKLTSRDPARIALVEAYSKAQGMWRDTSTPDPVFTDVLELDLSTVQPSLAGPKRPQDRVLLKSAAPAFAEALPALAGQTPIDAKAPVAGTDYELAHGHVVIAAITSCTNTSNPSVMLAAGLVAKKALEKGLKAKPWVKTSLAPGSQVVTDYLAKAGVDTYLDQLGFNLVGYGCTTCIGNSGPLPEPIADAISAGKLVVASVLSGNRNFEGRVHAQVKANYLASPPLVVAYALAGSILKDVVNEPLGETPSGEKVYLKDIWPTAAEVAAVVQASVGAGMFASRYGEVFKGDEHWQAISAEGSDLTYEWDEGSTYVRHPPYFEGMTREPPESLNDIKGARVLALLGDSITTDHISPAGSIAKTSPAADYLMEYQIRPQDFNSYGSRRGNHEVMMRGTFANIRIKNEMLDGKEGGLTLHQPDGQEMSIYAAAMKYKAEGTPLVVIAGQEYGTGSSRDWAAKGTLLLGVKAVIAESFERIHRSNLVGMGVLPLVFKNGQSRKSLGLDGSEIIDIEGIAAGLKPRMTAKATITRKDGSKETIELLVRVDTLDEVEYYRHGGILHYVLRSLLASSEPAGRA
ncbi:aconitate hydratase [Arboricoccus pini]|uniref:Aconitate hydratase n=1 Tax=Arboricoccus pini TaxID=1963835 RepID=A0A212QQG7_9PROT|nr:aconitate hydratase AcnA [Arboricoccus pini]SNB61725.1 aconitate hydratase [Arboricoccus pini]